MPATDNSKPSGGSSKPSSKSKSSSKGKAKGTATSVGGHSRTTSRSGVHALQFTILARKKTRR